MAEVIVLKKDFETLLVELNALHVVPLPSYTVEQTTKGMYRATITLSFINWPTGNVDVHSLESQEKVAAASAVKASVELGYRFVMS